MPQDANVRRSARLLVVDDADRLLLLRFAFHPGVARDQTYGWGTPGGGVRDGEPLASAAAREAAEEVGLDVSPGDLGDVVAYTTGYADIGFMAGQFRDDFFFVRVASHVVDTSRMEQLERSVHAGEQWWSIEELTATDEIVYPYGLVPLLGGLIAGRHPGSPVALPWHH